MLNADNKRLGNWIIDTGREHTSRRNHFDRLRAKNACDEAIPVSPNTTLWPSFVNIQVSATDRVCGRFSVVPSARSVCQCDEDVALSTFDAKERVKTRVTVNHSATDETAGIWLQKFSYGSDAISNASYFSV